MYIYSILIYVLCVCHCVCMCVSMCMCVSVCMCIRLCCRLLCEVVVNFQTTQEEVTLSVRPDKVSLRNYVDDEPGLDLLSLLYTAAFLFLRGFFLQIFHA
jgi:hypothetical protein